MSKRDEIRKKREARAKRNQMWVLGGITLIALAIAGYFIFDNYQKQVEAAKPVGDIIAIEKGTWPQAAGKILGSATAPVLIREFADFQCPYCGRFALEMEPQLVEEFIATEQARFEYHHYVVVDGNVGGNESRRAAEASECANAQGEFWNYNKLVFTNQHGEGQGAFADRRLKAFAENLGLDTAAFNTCFDSGRYASNVRSDEALARSLGISGTPTVFVNDTRVSNPLDINEFRTLVSAALNQ